MTGQHLSPPEGTPDVAFSSSSTMASQSEGSSGAAVNHRVGQQQKPEEHAERPESIAGTPMREKSAFENEFQNSSNEKYADMSPKTPKENSKRITRWVSSGGKLRPFRLLRQDIRNIKQRYVSDWTLFNQLVFASAVYVFFTNILPGITFASDLYVLTGKTWGTIEIVFSTGLCGIIFSLYVWNILSSEFSY